MSEREPPTTAPRWRFDRTSCGIVDENDYLVVEQCAATDDEMRLMAAALDLRDALYELSEATVSTFLERAQKARALLAALPVLPSNQRDNKETI